MKAFTGFLVTLLFSVFSFAGFQAYQSTTNLGLFQAVKCSTGLTCTKVNEKLNIVTTSLGTFHATTSTATAVSISSSLCGSTYRNTGSIEIGLPTATSAIIGCRLTFITGISGSNFFVNPDNGDTILVQTNAAGDRVSNAVKGNTIVLQAAAVSEWVVIGSPLGTWGDGN